MLDDEDIKPLVIDTSTATASDTVIASQLDHTGVDPDAARSSELPSRSMQSSPVLPIMLAASSEFCDEVDEELAQRDEDGSPSSDSLSTSGSTSKDVSGSVSTGDLSPGPGTAASCSKSRRKSDRVCTTTICHYPRRRHVAGVGSVCSCVCLFISTRYINSRCS